MQRIGSVVILIGLTAIGCYENSETQAEETETKPAPKQKWVYTCKETGGTDSCVCDDGVISSRICQENGDWGDCVCSVGSGDSDSNATAQINEYINEGTASESETVFDTAISVVDTDTTAYPTDTDSASNEKTCGNGTLDPDEACDDGNNQDDDGCSADCQIVDWIDPGCGPGHEPCHRVSRCGDGMALLPEMCDDGNLENGDGCSDICHVEPGFKCEGEPSRCVETVCGDGRQEGSESCDDGNDMPLDGCSPLCQLEPTCVLGQVCESTCGDRMITGEETCDDGNIIDGDGCSSHCQTEPGYICNVESTLPSPIALPMILRDFDATHVDFSSRVQLEQEWVQEPRLPVIGLVLPDLSDEKKPVYYREPYFGDSPETVSGLIGTTESYATWYSDHAPKEIRTSSLVLHWDEETGRYVNMAHEDGGRWERLGKTYTGNPLFFPLDNAQTPTQPDADPAQIPSSYFGYVAGEGTCLLGAGCNPCWPIECVTGESESDCLATDEPLEQYDCYEDAPRHNFLFTLQSGFWFTYTDKSTPVIEFQGEGDMWIFVKGRLVLDLGGIHSIQQAEITLDDTLGLVAGEMVEVSIFYAQRQSYISTFRLSLSGFADLFTDVGYGAGRCEDDCGDGIVSRTEECDDGINDGGYGECYPGCKLGAYCGDGVIQPEYEECDDGNVHSEDGCSSACRRTGVL